MPLALILGLLCALASVASGDTGSAPWLAGPFAASPEAMRQAADRRLPASLRSQGAPVVVLWRDETLQFDAEGRAYRSRHWVYRIDSAAALETWGQSEVAWSPWSDAVPRLRARVVTADGAEHWLDDGALAGAVQQRERDRAGEIRRLVRLPLPAIGVGAVVEEELIVEEHRPPFLAERHGRLALALPVPVVQGRLRFIASEGMPLTFKESLLDGIEAAISGGGERRYDYGPLPAARVPEPGLLPQDPRFPTVSFSSGTGWDSVARTLTAVIDPLLAAGEGPPSRVPRRTTNDVDRIAELLTSLHRRIEPIERPLSLAARPPRSPQKVLSKGRGDGLEKALVLVSWLRAEGIPAFVALLASGPGQDIDPELPGEQLFDRPMVYVPGGESIWIDISDPWARPGELDSQVTGRQALVLSADSSQLVRLPWAQADDHHSRTTIEIYLADEGPSRIVETNDLEGFAARAQRRLLAGLDIEQRRQAYLGYVQSAYHAPHLGVVDDTAPDNLIVPYRLRLEALDAERAFTADQQAAVAVSRRDLVTSLSPELLTTPRGSRRGDYFFARPQWVERRYRIHLPEGMVPKQLPANEDRAVGSGRLRQQARHRDGLVEIDLSFHSGPIFLSARQFEVYRQAVSEILLEDAWVLWFERPAD